MFLDNGMFLFVTMVGSTAGLCESLFTIEMIKSIFSVSDKLILADGHILCGCCIRTTDKRVCKYCNDMDDPVEDSSSPDGFWIGPLLLLTQWAVEGVDATGS